MRYTQEEMRERRLAVEAARAEQEAKEERTEKRGRKRKASKEMVEETIGKRTDRQEFNPAQSKEIRKIVDKVLEEKVFRPMQQVETVDISKDGKIYRKFTCEELIKIFGGWFTLRYLFSVQDEKQVNPLTGKPIETDFYVCSQDVSGMSKKDLPPRNEALHKQFGVDVYGFCIIAPSTAF